jgi:hypothetical protein
MHWLRHGRLIPAQEVIFYCEIGIERQDIQDIIAPPFA